MSRPARILIACTRCQTRKIRCDGNTPQCGHCVAKGVECVYATARQYRGKGKKSKEAEYNKADEALSQNIPSIQHVETPPPPPPGPGIPISVVTAAVQAFQPLSITNHEVTTAPSSFFPSFLLPGAYESYMTQVKSAIKDNNARHAPTPLIPREIVRRLLQNAYSDMLERWPFLCSLDELLTLLDTQYDTSGTSFVAIAGSALIQVVVALAIRQKMAAGAESHISGISHAYYRNACLLMGDLVLVAPSQHTVQALKAMAAFAGGTPDRHAEAMLLMNAEYIEKLTQGECP